MNKANNHIHQNIFRLLTVFLFLLSSNITYSQYYKCQSTNPCGDLGNYTLSGHEWNKSVLKYYFINDTDDIDGEGEKTAFYTAFDKWSAVIPIRFEEVFTQSEADIKIFYADLTAWESTRASDASFAITYFPEQECKGNIVVNDNKVFSLNPPSSGQVDLYYVALHEIGHVLGLCHSVNSSCVMYLDSSGGIGKRSLSSYDIQGIQLIYPSISVTAQNNFDGGSIYVNDFSIAKTSPYNFEIETGNEVDVNLGAIEQSDGTYERIWNDVEAPLNLSTWVKESSSGSISDASYNKNHNFNASQDDANSTYEAGLRKVFNVSLSNQFSGITMGGQMDIIVGADTNTINVPITKVIVEQNPIVFQAKDYYDHNNIRYIFDKWDDNTTSKTRTIYPTSHKQYAAIYLGHPIFNESSLDGNLRNLSFSGVKEGDVYYIKLNWNDHPNTNVTQYHIYRYVVDPDGIGGNKVHIATKNRGNTTFTDYSYSYSPTAGQYRVYYDVKAYFSPDGTTSTPNYKMVRGEEINNQAQKKGSQSEELIKEYAISNFPNPFNPSTRITYQLPKAGHVQIKVYDAIGKEVATLVNKHMEVGKYEVSFGKNDLPSGMYIYTIKVNDYFASKKMLLIK